MRNHEKYLIKHNIVKNYMRIAMIFPMQNWHEITYNFYYMFSYIILFDKIIVETIDPIEIGFFLFLKNLDKYKFEIFPKVR